MKRAKQKSVDADLEWAAETGRKGDKMTIEATMAGIMASLGHPGFDLVFRLRDWAEQELEAIHRPPCAALGSPEWRAYCDRTKPHLQACVPTQVAKAMPEKLCRAFFRELIGRVDRGEDLQPGTKAEVLFLLTQVSLKGPLNPLGQHLYEHIFAELFPEEWVSLFGIRGPYVWSTCEAEDELASMQRKLAVADRGQR